MLQRSQTFQSNVASASRDTTFCGICLVIGSFSDEQQHVPEATTDCGLLCISSCDQTVVGGKQGIGQHSTRPHPPVCPHQLQPPGMHSLWATRCSSRHLRKPCGPLQRLTELLLPMERVFSCWKPGRAASRAPNLSKQVWHSSMAFILAGSVGITLHCS